MALNKSQIKRLQREAKETLEARGFPWRSKAVAVDGVKGPLTWKAANMAAWLQGLHKDALRGILEGKLSERDYGVLTHDRRRTAAMLLRDRRRRGEAQKLRRQHKEAAAIDLDGLEDFEGTQVAGWIIPWLEKARKKGWTGTVVSGYRTPEYSESLCYQMCGAPSCPGRCAGRNTNHARYGKGEGAVDVSDYTRFGQIMAELHAPLKNVLGPADPVHFSSSGR